MQRLRSILCQCSAATLFSTMTLLAQGSTNCFLQDAYPKTAVVPSFQDQSAVTATPNVTVTILGKDTLGQISNYVFGNAVAVWVGQDVNNPTVLNYLQMLAPTLIRYPGGSWSDYFFYGTNPGDLPDSLYDATNYFNGSVVKTQFWPQFGPYVHPTPDSYYNLRAQLGTQGLITVNYAYARYGRSAHPVEEAAHYAANWVRFDNGRTAFWEIGNENAGPWEPGWLIDSTKNQDGQPAMISGDLYGRHFKVFADSMRAAAAAVGATIYIGGQLVQFDATNDVSPVNRTWNEGFLQQVGDAADFYVIHDYFGNNATNIKGQVDNARTAIVGDLSFVRQDIANKGGIPKPIALTEWNTRGPDAAKTSIANGMQAVSVFCELLKNNAGMSARWLIANWDADGMFYFKEPPDAGIPLWNPRPDFYYLYYLNRVIGDHVLDATVTGSGSPSIYAYATRFSSGHTGVVVLNVGTSSLTVELKPDQIGVGDRYYVYTLTGVDNTTWPQEVVANNHQPTGAAWGPLDSLLTIPAAAYPVGSSIRVSSPRRSVEYILIDNGTNVLSSAPAQSPRIPDRFDLEQNYPNPFNPKTVISGQWTADSDVRLEVFDILGRKVATLADGRYPAGKYAFTFDGTNLASGMYFYRLEAGGKVLGRKMTLMK